MTRFADLSTLPKNGEPCGMVKAYYEHVLQLGTLATFLEGFDFDISLSVATTPLRRVMSMGTYPQVLLLRSSNHARLNI